MGVSPSTGWFDLSKIPMSPRRWAYRVLHWLCLSLGAVLIAVLGLGIYVNVTSPYPGSANLLPGFAFLTALILFFGYATTEAATRAQVDVSGVTFASPRRALKRFHWAQEAKPLVIRTFARAGSVPGSNDEHITSVGTIARPVWLGQDLFDTILSEAHRRGVRVDAGDSGVMGRVPGARTARIWWGVGAVESTGAPAGLASAQLPHDALTSFGTAATTESRGEPSRRTGPRDRLLGVLAFIGIGLVVLSTIGQRYGLIWIAVPGFALILVGGVGLISSSRRQALRPVATGTAGAPSQPTGPALPARSSDVGKGFGLPAEVAARTPGSVDGNLHEEVAFDLVAEFQRYRSQMRAPVLMRLGVYAFFGCGGGLLLVTGVVRKDPVLIGIGIPLVAMAGILSVFVREVGRGVDRVAVGPDGIKVHMVPELTTTLPWSSPRFGLQIRQTPAAVNRTIDPIYTSATYKIFTGTGSGLGSGTRILTEIPVGCANLILAQARAHSLRVDEQTEGQPGTVSERRVLRITH